MPIKKTHTILITVVCLFLILLLGFLLDKDFYKSPKTCDILYLEFIFFLLAELAHIFKQYNK